jgi:hypothetical protein
VELLSTAAKTVIMVSAGILIVVNRYEGGIGSERCAPEVRGTPEVRRGREKDTSEANRGRRRGTE